MIVYVVESGEYSDYHIDAIFESEQMAKDFVAAGGGDDYTPWELNTWKPEQGKWEFHFSPETGSIVSENRKSSLKNPTYEISAYSWQQTDPIVIEVKTGDRDRAVKIASERYAQIMAQFDNAKTLLDKSRNWYKPGERINERGLIVEIAQILAGVEPLPAGSEWTDKEGNVRFGYSTHARDIYKIMGLPFTREPQ